MADPTTSKKVLYSAIGTLGISLVLFYLGNRYGEIIIESGRNFFEYYGTAFSKLLTVVAANPLHISKEPMAMLCGGAVFLVVWLVWLRYVAFIGNYRAGEESGSARWGTKKEGIAFKDQKNPDNNLLFTESFGLALKRPNFDLELDRNLNVVVIGGSGSGKTRNFVKPNLMQLNASYFVTDPKGTLLPETGHLFEQNDYEIRCFNTINFDQSMHYNPLHYVKTDADILSFVNCLIANTSGDGTKGDPFWENSERLLYTALIALLRDWFPKKDYSLSGLLTLLSMAEARENDENFRSALDLMFLQIQDGKRYTQGGNASVMAGSAGDVERERGVASGEAPSAWSWTPSKFVRNSDGVRPADCGGLSDDEDFALSNYNAFKVAAGKTLKSIIISCNVRLKPLSIREVRELLTYDEMKLDTLGDRFVTVTDENGKTVVTDEPRKRTIIYGILSDTDRTFAFLFAIMMWQTIDQLCRKALDVYNGKLPNLVNFILDEFANIGEIPDVEKTIAVTRSRNIGMSIILQSVSQLESQYEKKADTIIDCCDTMLFLGGKSNKTNKEIAELIGKQTISQMSYSENTGQSSTAGKNTSTTGRDLIDAAEIGKMSRKKAILLIAGTNPLMDNKYPIEKHERYAYVDPGHKGSLVDKPFDFVRYHKGLPQE